MLIKTEIGKIENNIFLLLSLFSLTTLDIPDANPKRILADTRFSAQEAALLQPVKRF